jgi:hypothetical protein
MRYLNIIKFPIYIKLILNLFLYLISKNLIILDFIIILFNEIIYDFKILLKIINNYIYYIFNNIIKNIIYIFILFFLNFPIIWIIKIIIKFYILKYFFKYLIFIINYWFIYFDINKNNKIYKNFIIFENKTEIFFKNIPKTLKNIRESIWWFLSCKWIREFLIKKFLSPIEKYISRKLAILEEVVDNINYHLENPDEAMDFYFDQIYWNINDIIMDIGIFFISWLIYLIELKDYIYIRILINKKKLIFKFKVNLYNNTKTIRKSIIIWEYFYRFGIYFWLYVETDLEYFYFKLKYLTIKYFIKYIKYFIKYKYITLRKYIAFFIWDFKILKIQSKNNYYIKYILKKIYLYFKYWIIYLKYLIIYLIFKINILKHVRFILLKLKHIYNILYIFWIEYIWYYLIMSNGLFYWFHVLLPIYFLVSILNVYCNFINLKWKLRDLYIIILSHKRKYYITIIMIKTIILTKIRFFYRMIIIPQRFYNFIYEPDYRLGKILIWAINLNIFMKYIFYFV